MKNWIHYVIMVFIVIIILTFIACDDKEPPEQPKNQSTIITSLFDNNASVTIKGYLTDSEWNGVSDIMENALNSRFETVSDAQKEAFRHVYSSRNVIIILEKNPSYNNYNAPILNGNTVYINFGILNNTDALGLSLSRTNQVMNGNTDTPKEG